MTRTPLLVLATVDPVIRDATIFGMVTDQPRLVVVRHDLLHDEDGGSIRRVVLAADGVVEDRTVALEHACLSCAVREDAVPTLARLAADDRWDTVLLALPVSAESLPVTRALAGSTRADQPLHRLRLAHVVAALDVEAFADDVLGDDLLAERGLALGRGDRRAVGEAIAAQVAHADTVLVHGDPRAAAAGSDLLDHLRAADGLRVDGPYTVTPRDLVRSGHEAARAQARLDPVQLRVSPRRALAPRAWTLELRSPRALHPDRLVQHVRRLGDVPVRSRGRFWVPSRPDSLCVWDGSGRQLSVGQAGRWGAHEPETHLVFTGIEDVRAQLVEAFEDVLLTADEAAAGLAPWLGREDALADWLGSASGV